MKKRTLNEHFDFHTNFPLHNLVLPSIRCLYIDITIKIPVLSHLHIGISSGVFPRTKPSKRDLKSLKAAFHPTPVFPVRARFHLPVTNNPPSWHPYSYSFQRLMDTRSKAYSLNTISLSRMQFWT